VLRRSVHRCLRSVPAGSAAVDNVRRKPARLLNHEDINPLPPPDQGNRCSPSPAPLARSRRTFRYDRDSAARSVAGGGAGPDWR